MPGGAAESCRPTRAPFHIRQENRPAKSGGTTCTKPVYPIHQTNPSGPKAEPTADADPISYALSVDLTSTETSFCLFALQKYSDLSMRAMAESVLWAYFPDEPTNNYPQAVQRFLASSY